MDPAGSAAEVLTFKYDAIDNIVSQTSSLGAASPANVGDYKYEDAHPNAVTAAGTMAMAYDAAGELVTRGSASYKWNFLGHLTEVTRGGEVLGDFVYGDEDDRVMKLEDGGAVYYVTETSRSRTASACSTRASAAIAWRAS